MRERKPGATIDVWARRARLRSAQYFSIWDAPFLPMREERTAEPAGPPIFLFRLKVSLYPFNKLGFKWFWNPIDFSDEIVIWGTACFATNELPFSMPMIWLSSLPRIKVWPSQTKCRLMTDHLSNYYVCIFGYHVRWNIRAAYWIQRELLDR